MSIQKVFVMHSKIGKANQQMCLNKWMWRNSIICLWTAWRLQLKGPHQKRLFKNILVANLPMR